MVILVVSNFEISAKVILPRLVSNHMVLQRGVNVKLWGWAAPNESIIIHFKNHVYDTCADENGNWEYVLKAQKAGGPYVIKINNLIVEDVMFGDVWLCSGQSNMDLPISRVLDLYKNEVKSVNNTNIRLFKVSTRYNFTNPESDLDDGEWKVVSPSNVLDFSAVSYFFGKELYDYYKVPIGLLNSSHGGTPIEAWLSDKYIKKYPAAYLKYKLASSDGYVDSVKYVENESIRAWDKYLDNKDKGYGKWMKDGVDTSDWNKFIIPGVIPGMDNKAVNGVYWFRKSFNITSEMAGKAAILRMGRMVDSDSVFVNGSFVGNTTYQYPPRIYNIPLGLLKAGENVVTVRLVSENGSGAFIKDKPYKVIVGDSEISLKGEWRYKLGAKMNRKPSSTFFDYYPVGLYNGMLAPLFNYKIKGAVWYQGESNTGDVHNYGSMLEDLINEWRKSWNEPKMPVLFVQLPNYMKEQVLPVENGGWPEMREVQRKALKISNTGMAIIIDLGEWNDIHPLHKKEVGYRLSLLARKIAYGEKNIVSSGPLFDKVKEIKNSNVVLKFKSVGKGLISEETLEGFAIENTRGDSFWVQAKITGKDQVTVNCKNVDLSLGFKIKYAWANNPLKANLLNSEHLPASPFTTQTLYIQKGSSHKSF